MVHSLNAAILRKNNNPLEIINLKIPPLKKGQVLIKIFYSGICRSQLMEIDGARGIDKYLPHMLGHEGTGEVVNIGKGVTKFKVKDEVILTWIKGTGLESGGGSVKNNHEIINYGPVSTFANYSIISENRLIKKPKNYSFKLATLFGCALPTGSGIIYNDIKLKKQSSIVIIGLGGVGMSSLIMCKALGNTNILAIDNSISRLEQASKYGVNHLINGNEEKIKQKVFRIFPNGVDFCVDAAGLTSTIELGFSLLNSNSGKLVFASHPKAGDFIKIDPHELILGKKIEGSWGGGVAPDRDIPIFCKILEKHKNKLEDFITKIYKLEDINIALSDLKNKKVLRPIIKMDH